jgi:hypothetical protein
MTGDSVGMPIANVVVMIMIRANPPERQSRFAQEIWAERPSNVGPTGPSDHAPF